VKVAQGRYRLIFSVSVVDQCVERFFAQIQNKAEIANWHNLPSLIGIGFTKRQIRAMADSRSWFQDQHVVESDVSGWDWTVQPGEIINEGEARLQLMEGHSLEMENLVRNRMTCIINKMVVFSDGEIDIVDGGIWPSGLYITGSGNSRMRATLGLRAREWMNIDYTKTRIKCVGDDSVESDDVEKLEDLKEAYEHFGHRIKDIKRSLKSDFEFCSCQFLTDQGLAVPLNIEKSVFRWLQGSRNPDQTAALRGMCENLEPTLQRKVTEVIARFGMPCNDTSITNETGPPTTSPDGQHPNGAGPTERQD